MKKCLLLFLFLWFFPGIALAEIVKCIDYGQVTYRNSSCSNKDIRNLPEHVSQPNIPKKPAVPEPMVEEPSVQDPVANTPAEEPVPVLATITLSVPLKNGSYYVAGSVGGIPANFQIDTGASNTAVSKRIADQAGYFESYCPKKVDAATANGVIGVCLVTIPELTFGEFSVKNVEVIIMPNMLQEALLGMDVLQHYIIEQRARALKISN